MDTGASIDSCTSNYPTGRSVALRTALPQTPERAGESEPRSPSVGRPSRTVIASGSWQSAHIVWIVLSTCSAAPMPNAS